MSLLTVVFLALAVAALAGLVFALIGRRVGAEPRCARCGFDITGIDASAGPCPECGAPLNGPKSVRHGRRRRRWRLAWSSVAVLVIAGAGLTALVPAVTRAALGAAPPGILLTLTELGSSGAHAELDRRIIDGTLPPELQRKIADLALVRGPITGGGYRPEWSRSLELVRTGAGLTQEQLATYLEHALEIRLRVRPRVNAEKGLPYRIEHAVSALVQPTPGMGPLVEIALTDLRLDGRSLLGGGRSSQSFTLAANGNGWSGSIAPLGTAIGPGTHTVEVTIEVTMHSNQGVYASAEIEQSAPMQIVPPDEPVVTLLGEGVGVDDVARAIRLGRIDVLSTAPEDQWDAVFRGSYALEPHDTPFAFDVFILLPDGSQMRAGQLAQGAMAPGQFSSVYTSSYQLWARDLDPDLPKPHEMDWPETVDVLLVPSTEAAYGHPDIEQIYGGELLFKGVAVNKSGDLNRWSSPTPAEMVAPERP